MSVSLAVKLALEYMRLIQEGWDPDLEEFLSRVPNPHRDACREQIQMHMAAGNEPAVDEVEAPAAEAVPEEPVAADEPEVVAEPEVVEEPVAVDEPEVFDEPELVEEPVAAAESAEDSGAMEGVLEFSLFDEGGEVTETGEATEVEATEEPVAVEEAVAADEPVAVEEPVEAEEADGIEVAVAADEPVEVEEAAEAEEPVVADEPEELAADEVEESAEDEAFIEVEVEVDELAGLAHDEEPETEEPPRPALLSTADELRALTDELAHEAEAEVEECVADLAAAVGVEAEPETATDVNLEEAEVDGVPDEGPAEPEEAEAEPVAPKGPQRLSKEEAMAMWSSQLSRIR